MSSDDAYAAFLDKANEDPSAGQANTAEQPRRNGVNGTTGTNGVHSRQVPERLVTAARDRFYVSDSDEPWVPVSFDIGESSSLPTEGRYCSAAHSRLLESN